MKRLLKTLAYTVAPAVMGSWEERRYLQRRAAQLRSHRQQWRSGRECYEALLAAEAFVPAQRPSEFAALLDRLEQLRPARVCEIGAGGGGTLLCFAQTCAAPALVISIDLRFSAGRKRLLEGFGTPQRRIVCCEADSHLDSTRKQVEQLLAGEQLDFLFIDGDHSYAGVADDFAQYGPLVRPGGLIAFHDIAPDLKTRCGVLSSSDTGEVPRFWSKLKSVAGQCEELIENPSQDGFGIGLITWNGQVVPG